jgi:hypothetical protein
VVDVETDHLAPRVQIHVEAVGDLAGFGAGLRLELRIPMISTGYSDRSRPPFPTDRDHFSGRGRGVVRASPPGDLLMSFSFHLVNGFGADILGVEFAH